MKQLYDYLNESAVGIFEAHMSAKEWEHRGDYAYALKVVSDLIDGKPVVLGSSKAEGSYTATPEEIEELKKFDPTQHTYKEFNNIFSGNLKWSDIFKGAYSGYTGGADTKNKGNAFEYEYAANFHEKYQADLEKDLGMKRGELDNYNAENRGAENQKRPLVVQGNSIVLSSSHETIGDSVVDVELAPFTSLSNGDKSINLSLKYGRVVTFCNAGIAQLFPKQSFDKYEKDGGTYEPAEAGAISGQQILDMFCIDNNKFADTYINVGKKKDYDTSVDVTKELNSNKEMIFDFLKSVVGYDYVLVHKIGNKVHNIDLRKESDMKKLIGNSIKNAVVEYGGRKGTGKSVEIHVELSNMKLKFNLRNKQGGLYPTSLMADYTIFH